MTKEEIDRLFECIENKDIEGFLDFVNSEEKDKFLENYDWKIIYSDIASKIPEEVIEYYCDRAINVNAIDFICYISDDNVKLKLLNQLEGKTRLQLAQSIQDNDIKVRLLNVFEGNEKLNLAQSIQDDNIKLGLLNIFEGIDKLNLAKSMQDDTLKLDLLNEFEEGIEKLYLSQSMRDDNIKLELLNEFENEDKLYLAQSIQDDNIKLGLLNEFEKDIDKLYLIKTIRDNEIRLKGLQKISQTFSKISDIVELLKSKNINEIPEYMCNDLEETLLELPSDMTIGVELETEGLLSFILLNESIVNNWKCTRDISLKNGVEIVSPILHDNIDDMKMLEIVCNVLKKTGLEATDRCGGHIHIGAAYLEDNPQALENLMTIWNECEELFYKMSNEKGVIPREGIIEFAKTQHQIIEENSIDGKIEIKSKEDFMNLRSKIIEQEEKYFGLNLGHYGEDGKNTIEFRIPNGTINTKALKENIKLFGKLMQVSKEMALNPEHKKENFEKLKDREVTEGEKVETLLDLLFDDEKNKSIYRERWDFVKDEEIFFQLTLEEIPTFERGNYEISEKDSFKEIASSKEAIQEKESVCNEFKRDMIQRQTQFLDKDK